MYSTDHCTVYIFVLGYVNAISWMRPCALLLLESFVIWVHVCRVYTQYTVLWKFVDIFIFDFGRLFGHNVLSVLWWRRSCSSIYTMGHVCFRLSSRKGTKTGTRSDFKDKVEFEKRKRLILIVTLFLFVKGPENVASIDFVKHGHIFVMLRMRR